jgi:hypothetical protein
MLRAEVRRHDEFADPLAGRFGRAIPEGLLCHWIESDDARLLVDHNHAVERGIDNCGFHRFALAQLLEPALEFALVQLQLGDVAHKYEIAGDCTVRIAVRGIDPLRVALARAEGRPAFPAHGLACHGAVAERTYFHPGGVTEEFLSGSPKNLAHRPAQEIGVFLVGIEKTTIRANIVESRRNGVEDGVIRHLTTRMRSRLRLTWALRLFPHRSSPLFGGRKM